MEARFYFFKKMLKQNKITKISRGAILFAVLFVFSFSIARASEISSQNVIKLVNSSRIEAGLSLLVENNVLTKIANDKAQDMLDKKYFAHISPDGLSPWYWFGKEKYDYSYAGENLAIDFVSAESQHAAWMKSEKHRENILNNYYNEIGVAVAAGEISGHMSIFTVQVFGTPAIAGNGSRGGENFSAEKRTVDPALQKGNGVVLSSKNLKEFNSQIFSNGKQYANNLGKAIQQNPKGILDASFIFVLVLALLALVVNPLVFISKSWDKIYSDFKKIWREKFYHKKPVNDFSKVQIGKKIITKDLDVVKLNKIRI